MPAEGDLYCQKHYQVSLMTTKGVVELPEITTACFHESHAGRGRSLLPNSIIRFH
ncbi:hypothetical protein [Ignatzschineria sp. F8392]|uniref:hypothetical protein n=1 Tax=Ignatzschineria sp. F8392 TaxID=1980117 RepID=UPI0013032FDE|nr:hypothetical protein [Ignatzschineria sp. F8392]